MKCDELVELSDGYYIKEDVDEAIAELKDVIRKHEAKNKWRSPIDEREWNRKWKKEHPEKIKEIQMRYIRKNLDKWKAYLREWRRKKKEAAKLQGVA